jgi:hypothetical protein
MTARGIRNNNPLNIDKGDEWQGLAADQPDSRFCTFIAPEWGFRAAAKILLKYQSRYALGDVEGIVHRWAPPVENDSNAYSKAVAKAMGIEPDMVIDLKNSPTLLLAMLRAMCVHENGSCPYPDSVIQQGMILAGIEHVHNPRGICP